MSQLLLWFTAATFMVLSHSLIAMTACDLTQVSERLINLDLNGAKGDTIYYPREFEPVTAQTLFFIAAHNRKVTPLASIPNGYYIYVTTDNGQIAIAKGMASPEGIKANSGHSTLSRALGSDVVAAGEALIIDGKFIWFTNRSGGFRLAPYSLINFYQAVYKINPHAIVDAEWYVAKPDGSNVHFFTKETVKLNEALPN